jgi:hypothetical protein
MKQQLYSSTPYFYLRFQFYPQQFEHDSDLNCCCIPNPIGLLINPDFTTQHLPVQLECKSFFI